MVNSIIKQGLSGISKKTAYSGLQRGRNITYGGENPTTIVDAKVSSKSIEQMQYPQDLGKYQFVIIESEFGNAQNTTVGVNNIINFQNMYRLPLPVPLTEEYATQFDKDFNLMSQAQSVLSSVKDAGGALNSLFGTSVTAAGAAGGLSVNQYKTVTLKNPEFRTHELSWKFSPKNYQESVTIRNIAFNLKKAMAPRLLAGRTLFGFPKVFIMFFVPNMQFLYKFKPCVLQNFAVDYLGGNPSPAFFGNGDASGSRDVAYDTPTASQNLSYSSSNNPPESVIFKTRWLELEYWVADDFKSADSTDFTDVFNWYDNKSNAFVDAVNNAFGTAQAVGGAVTGAAQTVGGVINNIFNGPTQLPNGVLPK